MSTHEILQRATSPTHQWSTASPSKTALKHEGGYGHGDGSLFRGRYKAILVNTHEYLGAVVRYIHLNPVEVAVVEMPEDHRLSSHGRVGAATGCG